MMTFFYEKDGIRIEEFNDDDPDEQWFLFWEDQDGFKRHSQDLQCAHCCIWRKPQKAESIAPKNLSEFHLTETSYTNLEINN